MSDVLHRTKQMPRTTAPSIFKGLYCLQTIEMALAKTINHTVAEVGSTVFTFPTHAPTNFLYLPNMYW